MTENFTIVDEEFLIFHSDKQWEEYDILTKIDGYVLDFQDVSSGIIKVSKESEIQDVFISLKIKGDGCVY